eukprot:FR737406.1.p3 GENE.FR737406.1~~FR737406.1.p3  ORF type:complete len:101 (-),score=8.86 FR737406.1:681-950(-)
MLPICGLFPVHELIRFIPFPLEEAPQIGRFSVRVFGLSRILIFGGSSMIVHPGPWAWGGRSHESPRGCLATHGAISREFRVRLPPQMDS